MAGVVVLEGLRTGRSWNEIWHCLFDESSASKPSGQVLPGTRTCYDRIAQYYSESCFGRVEQVQLSPPRTPRDYWTLYPYKRA